MDSDSFLGDKNVLKSIVVMVTQLCEHADLRPVHFKQVSHVAEDIACDLYLYKTYKTKANKENPVLTPVLTKI